MLGVGDGMVVFGGGLGLGLGLEDDCWGFVDVEFLLFLFLVGG